MKNISKFKLVFLIITIFCIKSAHSQVKSFQFEMANIAVSQNKQVLLNPFAGGINSGQFYRFNLNGSGPSDLLVFDRTNNRFITYIASQNTQNQWYWQHEPSYQANFPALESWVLLADYNGDGFLDLFTYGSLGIKVFVRNTKNNILQNANEWTLAANPIYYQKDGKAVNLQIGFLDKPDAVDIENDGDIDILAFDPEGDYVQLYKNMTQENKADPQKPIFVKEGFCWGNFYKEHCRDLKFNIDCQTGQIINNSTKNQRVLHAGNSIVVTDIDNDGLKDAIFGHVTCSNIGFLKNEGTANTANFKKAEYSYPNNQAIDFQLYPSVFIDDFDFDGKIDLLASPTVTSNNADYSIDFKNATWLVKGLGGGGFGAIKKDFLQDEMLDFGENSKPVFFDIDLDGDLDILVGNSAQRTSQGAKADAALLINIGNLKKPVFELSTNNFLSNLVNNPTEIWQQVHFFITDIDQDKKGDLIVRLDTFKGTFFYVLYGNRKTNEWPKTSWTSIAHKPTDQTVFYDLDENGVMDLLKMSAAGVFTPFINKGSISKPIWEEQAQELTLGKNFKTYSLNSFDLNNDGQPELYNGFDEINWKTKTILEKKITGNNIIESALGANLNGNFADIDFDGKMDLVLGNNAGGIYILQNKTEGIVLAEEVSKVKPILYVYPNPFVDKLTLNVSQKGEIQVFNTKGQLLLQEKVNEGKNEISRAKTLANGTYILIFESNIKQKTSIKLLK